MKILKRGHKDKYIIYKEYRHECWNCGCKFSFTIEDAEPEGDKPFNMFLIHCPQCNTTIRHYESFYDYKLKKKKKEN